MKSSTPHEESRSAVHARPKPPGAVLFTLFTADDRPILAVDPRAGAAVNDRIRALHSRHLRVLAWAVLADSVELLLASTTTKAAAAAMGRFKQLSALEVMALGHRRVWTTGIAAVHVRPQHDLGAVIDYVLKAPERAGLADRATGWPWCGSQQWPGMDPEVLARHPSGLLWLDALTSLRTSQTAKDSPRSCYHQSSPCPGRDDASEARLRPEAQGPLRHRRQPVRRP